MHSIQANQRRKNSRGELVTVIAAAFNRVAFVRDGFTCPCTWAEIRFTKEFTQVQGVTHV
ncbi:DUF4222 domain-containing protein [Pantoea rodasii]|uniref:DUF4222 domain-containing protein n=1 Tax=Pantoea rodasii TaxID=1076549 RepID=A0A2M9WCS6_9GAMM|nr:DUF4222 domain-containing protein [Pantoea rodasii]ORM60113.1 hypothetical protein HA45_22105 [Pantoea rodasii]PJZ05353.1 DUF4222 domain-containing protein [Pantoea rodasii]